MIAGVSGGLIEPIPTRQKYLRRPLHPAHAACSTEIVTPRSLDQAVSTPNASIWIELTRMIKKSRSQSLRSRRQSLAPLTLRRRPRSSPRANVSLKLPGPAVVSLLLLSGVRPPRGGQLPSSAKLRHHPSLLPPSRTRSPEVPKQSRPPTLCQTCHQEQIKKTGQLLQRQSNQPNQLAALSMPRSASNEYGSFHPCRRRPAQLVTSLRRHRKEKPSLEVRKLALLPIVSRPKGGLASKHRQQSKPTQIRRASQSEETWRSLTIIRSPESQRAPSSTTSESLERLKRRHDLLLCKPSTSRRIRTQSGPFQQIRTHRLNPRGSQMRDLLIEMAPDGEIHTSEWTASPIATLEARHRSRRPNTPAPGLLKTIDSIRCSANGGAPTTLTHLTPLGITDDDFRPLLVRARLVQMTALSDEGNRAETKAYGEASQDHHAVIESPEAFLCPPRCLRSRLHRHV